MNFISNIILVMDGCVELELLIICADILGLQDKNSIHKSRIVISQIVQILIFLLLLIIKYNFGTLGIFISMILFFLKFIPAIYILYERINHKILYLMFFCDLSVTLISTSISNIVTNITENNSKIVPTYILIFIRTAVLMIVLITGRKSNRRSNAAALLTIPKYIYIMLILTLIFLSATPSLITHDTDNTIVKENLLIGIVVILAIIFLCIIALLFLNVIAKQHFTAVSQMMQKQVELQIDHYKELEKMNDKISRFRHDYNNHLQGILSLIQANECSQAEDYILDLRDRINKAKSELHIFYTGNKLADALLSGKSSEYDEKCRIEYSGIIPSSINNVDLCVILSNALDNAIEACQKLPSPGVISVYATKQQGYFVLSVKNPTICAENYYTIPATTKTDKEQHGMGLYNIENTVKKHDGQMKIKCENGFFELMITMKI